MKPRLRGLHLLIVATVLQGCMVGPDYKRPDSGVPTEFAIANNATATQDQTAAPISST